MPAGGIASLTDGEYRKPIVEGSAMELVIRLADMAFGDLDGDAVEDVVVVLVTDPGGSSTFYDLVAVVNRDGEPEHIATASLRDRAKIQTLSIEAGHIVVEMTIHGPDDPMCCPSQLVQNTYALEGNHLVETASEALETASEVPGSQPQDLDGVVWILTSYGDPNVPAPVLEGSEITIVFNGPDGTYQVKADCNLSSGGYRLEGNNLTLEPGPTTLAECGPGSLYDEYLSRLGNVETFALDGEHLVLYLTSDAGSLVFGNAGPTPSS